MKIQPLSKVFGSSSWSLTTLALASAVALALPSTETRAALIAQESFDYSFPGNIGSASGGTGWLSNWQQVGQTSSIITSGGLTYPPAYVLNEAGNAIDKLLGNSAAGRREWDVSGTSAVTGGQIWYSFLLEPTSMSSGVHFQPVAWSGSNSLGGAGQEFFSGLGLFITPGLNPEVFARIGTEQALSGLPINVGSTNFLIGRIDLPGSLGGQATSSIWVNPGIGELGDPLFASVLTVANLGTSINSPSVMSLSDLDHLFFRKGISFTGALDEILIGTNLESVTVIPEPSRAVLIALAGLGLLFQRQRR